MSEEKTYLIDSIEDNDKPEVEWTTIDSNVGNIMAATKEAWRYSNHPQRGAIRKEYTDRVLEIMKDGQGNGYDRILYLSSFVYTNIAISEDDNDEENEFEFNDEEDEE